MGVLGYLDHPTKFVMLLHNYSIRMKMSYACQQIKKQLAVNDVLNLNSKLPSKTVIKFIFNISLLNTLKYIKFVQRVHHRTY